MLWLKIVMYFHIKNVYHSSLNKNLFKIVKLVLSIFICKIDHKSKSLCYTKILYKRPVNVKRNYLKNEYSMHLKDNPTKNKRINNKYK